jgi:ABC-type uncharacterized transport system substrate-binding protein
VFQVREDEPEPRVGGIAAQATVSAAQVSPADRSGPSSSLFPQLTAELVTLPVNVIVIEGGIRLVAKASSQVPVVNPTLFDPVGQGVASSLARPGGNVTGFTLMSAELDAKRLELLRTAFRISRR